MICDTVNNADEYDRDIIGVFIEVFYKEDPPNSLEREEVNNNDLGRRSPWWGGGRKEPATTIKAGASSWWGSFTQCGGTPRIMAG